MPSVGSLHSPNLVDSREPAIFVSTLMVQKGFIRTIKVHFQSNNQCCVISSNALPVTGTGVVLCREPGLSMLFLVKVFPEIIIKSRPVRQRFVRQLRKNLRVQLQQLDPAVRVTGDWDAIEVSTEVQEGPVLEAMIQCLGCTPGISLFLETEKHPLPDMDGIVELTLQSYGERLAGKTFAVRCKRSGKHAFRSVDVERLVGSSLNLGTEAAGVKLVNPDVTVQLEVRNKELFIVKTQHQGLGGFPLGCQDAVLSLISGGFDSAISSYLCIKRGLQTHYCFFNLGGRAHELAVKELALFLWMKYHSSHRVKFVTVPFENVVTEILTKVDNSQMGVVLKRMMLRAADKVAAQLHIEALVTGESVAQVSSQTLANLAVIDAAAETMVLRPLSTTDKQDIIDLSRHIGTEEFSKNIPEYCAVISNKPTTRARRHRIEREESRFDFAILDDSINNANYQLITELMLEDGDAPREVAVVSAIASDDVIIDIRHPSELEISPLKLPAGTGSPQVLAIPFYELRSQFDSLDRSQRFLLYCDKGMMSRLHAAHLRDEGFDNIAVLERPVAIQS